MKSQKIERKFVLGGEMKTDQGETLKEIVKQYYGAGTSADQKTIDECIKNVEARGFLEECRKAVAEQEKKRIHIGRLSINKVACLVCSMCSVILLCGFVAISYYIKGIKLDNKGNHEVIKYDLDPNSNIGKLNKIETYYDPAWVPEGYHIEWAIKHDKDYDILYVSDDADSDHTISYEQILPGINPQLSTENGKHEEVSFGRYYGEYVDTDNGNFLIVSDGVYVYILISAEDINKEDLIRMLH
jgi:hypothetical protein